MVTFGFYNSLNDDRTYSSKELSRLFEGIIVDGVFAAIGDAFAVEAATNMAVNVKTGRAWFNNTWTNNDAIIPFTIDAAEVILNRIDSVILEVSSNDDIRTNSIKVIKGDPASVPVAPTLIKADGVFQYPLAEIYIGAGVTSIIQANITPKVGTAECPFITGVMETIGVDAFIAQWASEFDVWFANIQAQLEGNVVTNLQNQINLRLQLAGGTMTGDIVLKGAPTQNLHPATKKYLDDLIRDAGKWKLQQSYTVAGTYLFVAPDLYGDGRTYELGVYIIGGGGSGGVGKLTSGTSTYAIGMGGGSGFTRTIILTVTPGVTYNVVVGAGGAARVSSATSTYSGDGNNGGSSSFNGTTALGGDAGKGGYAATSGYVDVNKVGSHGGQGGDSLLCGSAVQMRMTTPAMGTQTESVMYNVKAGQTHPGMGLNPFNDLLYLAAGGNAAAGDESGTGWGYAQAAVSLEDGGASSAGSAAGPSGPPTNPVRATSPGCGGGGVAWASIGGPTNVISSAAGADGAVLIYRRGA